MILPPSSLPRDMTDQELAVATQLALHPNWRPSPGTLLYGVVPSNQGTHTWALHEMDGRTLLACEATAQSWRVTPMVVPVTRAYGRIARRVPHLACRATIGALLLDLIDEVGAEALVLMRGHRVEQLGLVLAEQLLLALGTPRVGRPVFDEPTGTPADDACYTASLAAETSALMASGPSLAHTAYRLEARSALPRHPGDSAHAAGLDVLASALCVQALLEAANPRAVSQVAASVVDMILEADRAGIKEAPCSARH